MGPKDYENESNERDERDRRARLEAREDERDEERARETIMLAEASAREAFNDWVRAVTRPRYVAIANGIYVPTGTGKKRRDA